MPAFPFSSFHRSQLIFELRYDEAFLLWDVTGSLWSSIRKLFKVLKHTQVTPNQSTFIADGRFALSVGLDRAVITDHKPTGNSAAIVEVMAKFAEIAFQELRIEILNRVGTRIVYAMRCKDAEDAKRKALEAMPFTFATTKMFNIAATSFSPHIKIDASDGELAYTAQLYTNEKKYDFDPPPELSGWIEKKKETINELLFDIDFFTVKPIAVGSFNPDAWLSGCNRALNKDADQFLQQLAFPHGRSDQSR